MEGGNGVKALVCPEPLASFLGDAGLGTFEVFEGYAAQGNDDFGRNKAQLLVKDAMGAESGFFRRWCPVLFLGRHLMTFVVRTWSRVILTDQSALSRSCPLGPIRGQP